MANDDWKRLAVRQGGLVTRTQLAAVGVDRWVIRRRVASERWVVHTPSVIGTTTGELSREQLMWLGILHAGHGALIGALTAAERAGLRSWHRDEVTVLIPHSCDVGDAVPGIAFVRTRRDLVAMRRPGAGLPTCRLEAAVLLFAATQRAPRVAEGVLAASVQQQLTSPGRLLEWIDRLSPLRGAVRMRRALDDIAGGAHSTAEIDVRRMCRAAGLALPLRQVRRRDSAGRLRFTDCEWRLSDGRVLVLEVDGGFHMDVEHWEDDLARQRALTTASRVVVRCTSRELRDEPEVVARDLALLGVPAA